MPLRWRTGVRWQRRRIESARIRACGRVRSEPMRVGSATTISNARSPEACVWNPRQPRTVPFGVARSGPAPGGTRWARPGRPSARRAASVPPCGLRARIILQPQLSIDGNGQTTQSMSAFPRPPDVRQPRAPHHTWDVRLFQKRPNRSPWPTWARIGRLGGCSRTGRLRGHDRKRCPAVPASWEEVVEQVGHVLDSLRFAQRWHHRAFEIIAGRPSTRAAHAPGRAHLRAARPRAHSAS